MCACFITVLAIWLPSKAKRGEILQKHRNFISLQVPTVYEFRCRTTSVFLLFKLTGIKIDKGVRCDSRAFSTSYQRISLMWPSTKKTKYKQVQLKNSIAKFFFTWNVQDCYFKMCLLWWFLLELRTALRRNQAFYCNTKNVNVYMEVNHFTVKYMLTSLLSCSSNYMGREAVGELFPYKVPFGECCL